ncbi:MAG TPA: DUF1186 domain-containing protein [Candidatus Tectomicrobia bacterium]
MDTDRTIARLAFAERLPVGVIQACLSNRNEVVPAFIDLLQRCANNTPVSHEEESAIFLIVHILGELGEKEAFQPLMNFLAGDQERVNRVIGDAVTENLPKILISTFDGSTRRLYDVMNDAEVDEFVRDAVFRAWTYFVGMGEIDRDEARRYLGNGFETLRPIKNSYVWVSWADAVARLGFDDMRDLVRQTFAEGRVPDRVLDFRDFEDQLESALIVDDREAWMEENHLYPFTDTVRVLSKWHCFSEDFIRRTRQHQSEMQLSDTVRNPYRFVGRNDPCPCGGGKKFKNCCLH